MRFGGGLDDELELEELDELELLGGGGDIDPRFGDPCPRAGPLPEIVLDGGLERCPVGAWRGAP